MEGPDFTWVLYCPKHHSQGPRSVARCNRCHTLARKFDLYRYHAAGPGRCQPGTTLEQVQASISQTVPAGSSEHAFLVAAVKDHFTRQNWRLFHNLVPEQDLLDDLFADALAGHVIQVEEVAARRGLQGRLVPHRIGPADRHELLKIASH